MSFAFIMGMFGAAMGVLVAITASQKGRRNAR